MAKIKEKFNSEMIRGYHDMVKKSMSQSQEIIDELRDGVDKEDSSLVKGIQTGLDHAAHILWILREGGAVINPTVLNEFEILNQNIVRFNDANHQTLVQTRRIGDITEMQGKDVIRINIVVPNSNAELREAIQAYQKIVDKMYTEEETIQIREGLRLITAGMNNLMERHVRIDTDVLDAFRALVHDIRHFNAHNHEEVIPITAEVDDIVAVVTPIHTQATHHAIHGLGTPLLGGGASDYHPIHYQTMNNNNDTHVVGASAHEDNSCCCGCILM